MAYRFTDTDKWNDSWFTSLSLNEKLLFNYLCDICDIGGFVEINFKKWAVDLGIKASDVQDACKGIERGLVYSNDNDCLYIRNFLKHQKNLPINPKNKAHAGILKRFDKYMYKFDIQDITEFIESSSKGLRRGLEGASKGLPSPTGNGNGKYYIDSSSSSLSINDDNSIITEAIYDIYSFNEFWNDYDKKVGDKIKLERKWKILSDDVKLKIKNHIPKYKESQPEKKYRKNPETYLNNKSWNDEIINDNGNGNSEISGANSGIRQNTFRNNAEERRASVDRLADNAERILQNLSRQKF